MSNGWPKVPLGEVLRPVSRPVRVEAGQTYRMLGVRWYAAGLFIKDVLDGSEIRANRVFRVQRGDFVYNRLFAWKGSFAVADDASHDCYVSNEFPCYEPDEARIDVRFLHRYFSREPAWAEALGLSTGGTPTSRNRLKEEKLLAMAVPLPPLSEQRRIVARIESLAAKIAEAVSLATDNATARDVLGTHASSACIPWSSARMVPIVDLLREPTLNGIGLRPSESPPGHRILRISAGTSRSDAMVDEDDTKFIDVPARDVAKYRLIEGDLLACRFNGNLHFVGRFSHFVGRTSDVRLYPDKLIRFRLETSKVVPEYVCHAMNSPAGREQIESFCATTAGNIGISATELKTVKLPVPPLAEQRRIVAHLDALTAKTAALKQLQSQSAAELMALLPSILDRAFRGEL